MDETPPEAAKAPPAPSIARRLAEYVPTPITFPLFKYMEPRYADGLAQRGEIKIGTLLDYERHENPEIGDEEEGWYEGPGAGFDCVSYFQVQADNQLIFCASQQFDEALMNRWGGACVEISGIGFFEEIKTAMGSEVEAWCLSRVQYRPGRLVVGARGVPLACFTKREQFAHQQEVRAVWECPHGRRPHESIPRPQDMDDDEYFLRVAVRHRKLREYEKQRVQPRILTIPELTSFCRRLR